MQETKRETKIYWDNRKSWKCGKCGKTYSFDEFLKLTRIDRNENYGYIPICECGYRFLLDRWRLHDNIKLTIDDKEIEVLISTADLEFNHGITKDLWYETMIFINNENEKSVEEKSVEVEEKSVEVEEKSVEESESRNIIECHYQERYETKEEAIDDHNRILNILKNEKYQIYTIDNKKILYIT